VLCTDRRPAATGAPFTYGRTCALRVVDLDGDGRPEIVAGGARLAVLGAEGDERWRAQTHATTLTVANVAGDGVVEIVSCGRSAWVFDVEGAPLCQAKVQPSAEPVAVADLDGDGVAEIVVGHYGVSVLRTK